jgi:hypothetical protein
MSYSIYVLCRKPEPITRGEIAEFIEDGVFFDDVSFMPPAGSQEAAAPAWDYLEVHYDGDPQPVIIRRLVDSDVRGKVEIVETTLLECEVRMPNDVAAFLASVQQVFELQFHRGGGVSEDCWAMLDCLEAFLAKERDGIVFSSGDGIYDADLQPKVNW